MPQPTPYERFASFTSLQRADPTGVTPGTSLDVEFNSVKQTLDETLSNLVAQVAEAEPVVVYVGLPISLAGRETASTSDAIAVAKGLTERLSIPVRMVDERLSTVSAAGALRASNRSSKDGRKIIDQIAATIILEQAMATEKANQQWAGESIDDF